MSGGPDRRPVLITGPVQEEWMTSGACYGSDVEVFFPGRGPGADREAKRICAGCEVRQECLTYALDNHERHGVWAGTNERDRRKIRRQRRLGGVA